MLLKSLKKEAHYNLQSWEVNDAKKIPGARRVYRAKLNTGDGETKDVVLKFRLGHDARDDMVDESNCYKKQLAKLQGKIVPKYYGIFGRKTKQENTSAKRVDTCLILQYVGEPLTEPIEKLSPERR